MTVKERYEAAKEIYRAAGVDTDRRPEALKTFRFPCTAGREMM